MKTKLTLSLSILLIFIFFAGCNKEPINSDADQNNNLSRDKDISALSSTSPYIVGIDFGPDNIVYYWESSNVVTKGWADQICGTFSEYFIDGNHADVLAVATASDGRGYVWYSDGTVSAGDNYIWMRDYIVSQPFALPSGKSPSDIVGIAVDKNTDYCYAFYDDGTYSVGSPTDLAAYSGIQSYLIAPGETYANIIDVAYSNNNGMFYVWYNDDKLSAGTESDLNAYIPLKDMRAGCGSIMSPMAGIDIGSDDGVYFWRTDGQVSKGVSTNPTGFTTSYVLPFGKSMSQVVDMGISISGKGYVWYKDGTMSVGYGLYNFGDFVSPKPYVLPYGKSPSNIVGIAIRRTDDHCFAFYDDGTFSEGNSTDLSAYAGLQSYAISPHEEYYSIKDIGIAPSSGKFYVWFADDKMSVGSQYNLNDFIPLKPMQQ